MYASSLSSLAGFIIIAYDLESSSVNPVMLSQILFGIAAAINPVIVMDYFLKFLGNGFKRPVAIVQITETLMAISIPLYAFVKSERGLTFHMESLCMIGLVSSLISIIISLVLLVDFPQTSKSESALRWIGTVNGRDLPQDLSI